MNHRNSIGQHLGFVLLDENLPLLVHSLEHNRDPDGRVVVKKMALPEKSGSELTVYGGFHRSLPVLAHHRGFRVEESGVNHRARKPGVSKEQVSDMDLRTLQDWIVRLVLRTAPGVDDVTSWGGGERGPAAGSWPSPSMRAPSAPAIWRKP